MGQLTYVKKALLVADEDLSLETVIVAGCGLRNGEARAVNVNNVVAQYVYRVREQIRSNTLKPAKLKHRKAGDFREVPLPRSVQEANGTRRGTAPRRTAICCVARAATSPRAESRSTVQVWAALLGGAKRW
ncbi:hypothetical protein MIU24_24510 [Streptomyces venezuelae]|uniref:hypothetical protein n=1 Tax=Streptomyces sp. B6(2022) TaxID=3404749 RepID=UPI00311DBE17